FRVLFFFVAASPVADSEAALVARQEADIISILTLTRAQAILDATAIQLLAANPLTTEEEATAAFGKLTDTINSATTQIAAIQPVGTTKRQSSDDVAVLVAGLITDVTTLLDGVLGQLAGIPTIGGLFGGLDAALNQLLKGLEGLLAGVLNLVAQLLVNVADLLRKLALGLTLGSLGL
ncbi:hypothetical protein BKA62DRAFT_623779, partial [Auriculariales sp. MPI-PUGE-AT-0066]